MKNNIKSVKVAQLDLDQENARFENNSVTNQREAIGRMLEIKAMPSKIIELAEHICSYGTDPSEVILTIPHPENSKKFIVVEGNRRLLALKLLENPELFPPEYTSFKKKINSILASATTTFPTMILHSVLPNRKEANLWIELKHTGENKGSGRVQWDGKATDAFRGKNNPKSAGRIILDYIENDKNFDNELKTVASSLSITNLTRLFGTSESSNNLGYKISKGELLLHVPIEIFRNGIEAVISRLYEDEIKVSDIYDKGKREFFFKKRINPKDLPKKSEMSGKYTSINKINENTQTSSPSKKPKKTIKSKSSTERRKRLIDFSLSIPEKRINEIYLELKNKIDIHDMPNAGSVLFRVFLELTTDYALKNLKLNNKKPLSESEKLRKKITTVIEKLIEQKKLTKKQGQDLTIAASDNTNLFCSVDGIHRYIHGMNHPVPKELNKVMDNWSPYFKAIWAYSTELNN